MGAEGREGIDLTIIVVIDYKMLGGRREHIQRWIKFRPARKVNKCEWEGGDKLIKVVPKVKVGELGWKIVHGFVEHTTKSKVSE